MLVDWAEDGEIGVSKLVNSRNGYYDIILMDIRMPKVDGLQATQVIRNSNHPQAKLIPVIAMTANAFESDIRACLTTGMNGHIAKPIDSMTMYQTILSYIKF